MLAAKDELIYKVPTERVIAIGTYRNIRYAILNSHGKYPIAYVEKFGNKKAKDFPIDFKVTFDDLCYWNVADVHNYYGWEYKSTNKNIIIDKYPESNEVYIDVSKKRHKYTFDEIMQDIYKVIDYLLD